MMTNAKKTAISRNQNLLLDIVRGLYGTVRTRASYANDGPITVRIASQHKGNIVKAYPSTPTGQTPLTFSLTFLVYFFSNSLFYNACN